MKKPAPDPWWDFMNWNHRSHNRPVTFYELIMFGLIKRRTEIVRWDHPARRLAESLFKDDAIRRKD